VTAAGAVEPARAKVNLALHVTGRRNDGYHLLDSLVVFPPLGDVIRVEPAESLSLRLAGPGADALAGTPEADNLVMRAAVALRALAPGRPGAAITLEKALPVAAGLGGGSADAAAAIRALCRIWAIDPANPAVPGIALGLGADVPMCLASRPLRARGIGEALEPMEAPPLGIVLANPGVAVPTADVFRRLARRDNPPIPAVPLPDARGFLAGIATLRNDLEAPARDVAPAVGETLDALAALAGCRLARMSGSGATCFGLFDDADAAAAAASELARRRPGWWVRGSVLA
jgi:4-diphosphocytidyl-2-C-methyl-D-erythritol kinase